MNATQVHAFSSTVCAQPLREADVSFLALNPRSRNIDVDIVGERKYSKIAETLRIFLNWQTLTFCCDQNIPSISNLRDFENVFKTCVACASFSGKYFPYYCRRYENP